MVNAHDWGRCVGALLYWLEYHIRKREERSCTSGPNQWLKPKGVKTSSLFAVM